jgi:hypothetical protein
MMMINTLIPIINSLTHFVLRHDTFYIFVLGYAETHINLILCEPSQLLMNTVVPKNHTGHSHKPNMESADEWWWHGNAPKH